MTPLFRISSRLVAVFFIVVSFFATRTFAQDETLKGAIDGLGERVSTLESTVGGMSKLKITGYVQPQWLWNDADSLANQVNSRNYFQVRRGRVKFTYTTGDVSAVVYPDITENGVVMKEVYATWNALHSAGSTVLGFSMGAMNRPFGYEIGYSSSAREVTERSLFEQRFFNGERDLGLQLNITPTFGDIKPLIEVGLFNGADNFGTGPSGAAPGANNKMGFTSNPIGFAATPFAKPAGADSTFQAQVNAAVGKESALVLATQGGLPGGTTGSPIGQPAKELLGHFRVPFLISDDFSFDVGASISLGGITEPSNVIGTYTGTNGALVLANTGSHGSHTFSNQNVGFMETNRSIFGADAQFYLSMLPIGGTILKGELYSGKVPFYGSANLFTLADSVALGVPIASTIEKNVFGFYALLVQNLSDALQLAVRYEKFDPNTDVSGSNFTTLDATGKAAVNLRGIPTSQNSAKTQTFVNPSNGFGGDLAVNTISIDINWFISGAMRLMFDYDIVKQEEYTKNVGTDAAPVITTIPAPHQDRFTFRMQVKF